MQILCFEYTLYLCVFSNRGRLEKAERSFRSNIANLRTLGTLV